MENLLKKLKGISRKEKMYRGIVERSKREYSAVSEELYQVNQEIIDYALKKQECPVAVYPLNTKFSVVIDITKNEVRVIQKGKL